jgi:soluble lytic murein transglycosylase
MRTGPVLVLLAAVLAQPLAARQLAAPALAATPAEAELLAGRDAAMRGHPRSLEAWRARNPSHLLEPYAHYWLITASLARADAGEVRAFLLRNEGTPLAESLRRDWLKAVGAAGDWASFRAEYQGLASEDAEVTCLSLQDRVAQGDAEAAGEARALFLSSRETPPACDPAFAALAADARLKEAEVWDRLRRLLAANQVREARRVNALLPRRVAIEERGFDRAAAETLRLLSRDRTRSVARSSRELALFAIVRLARGGRADEAAERLVDVQSRLGPDAVPFAWSHIAYQAAMNHDPRALAYYERAGEIPLTEAQAAWKARAALRAGDWKAVLAAIQALPPEQAREPAWRYWRARAWRQLGEKEVAEGLFRSLAGELNFYGLLAAEETGLAPSPQWDTPRPAQDDMERVRAIPGVQRALALYRLELGNEALREWLWALKGLDDRSLLAAAEVARLANVPDRAIATADRTVQIHDFAQRYPVAHREALAPAARQWGLDEAMVYSIIRQESRFMPEARSRVGATGLMQLMPATARWVARQIPVQPYRQDMLVQPDTNILMGTYYFRRVLDDLGHPVLAAAAYNAGPGRARRWRDDRPLEGAVYVESIPFNETRDYVKKVFANAWFYRHRLEGKATGLGQMIGTVPGRAADPAHAIASNIP